MAFTVTFCKAMQFSPFNKPFKEAIDVIFSGSAKSVVSLSSKFANHFPAKEWAEKLLYVSECLDGWLKVQRVEG